MKLSKFKTFMEPFRIKSIEPIPQISREERKQAIEQAGLNVFFLAARDVMIDLLTDSGTGAMSHNQWSALMKGDEAYAGGESFFRFEEAVRTLTGMEYAIPVHQGRGAERIVFDTFRGKGEWVVSNMLFDTTRANAILCGLKVKDFPCKEFYDTQAAAPFKGNVDLEQLESFLKRKSVALFIMTITNNSAGGQPVSMENMKAAAALCKKYKVPMVLDACRFAENSWFIKERETNYSSQTPLQIAQETFAQADITFVSAKKDGMANGGGFLALRKSQLSMEFKNRLIPSEGFPTYGGMTGRDLETVAIGLFEALDESYLHYRIASVKFLHDKLKKADIPVVSPPGGHAVFIDAKKLLPQIPISHYPGQALTAAFYEFSGVRSCEIGSVMLGGNSKGKPFYHSQELVRLALPRRVYTLSHLEYVAEALELFLKEEAKNLRGVRFLFEPPILRHFTARFQWL